MAPRRMISLAHEGSVWMLQPVRAVGVGLQLDNPNL